MRDFRTSILRRSSLVVAAVTMIGWPTFGQIRPEQSEPLLFSDRVAAAAEVDRLAVVRSRPVTVDTAALVKLRPGSTFGLNLFEDAPLDAIVDKHHQTGDDTLHWQGRVQGDPESLILLVLHKGVVNGLVRGPKSGDFRIRPGRDGTVIDQINDAQYHPCGCGERQVVNAGAPANEDGGIAGPTPPPPADCPEFFDVMVVYTPEARMGWGNQSVAAIEAVAVLAVDATNAAYENSQVNARARLVHIAETPYTEAQTFGEVLNHLTSTSDGQMDEVHALRDQYGADMVDVLISHTNQGICGIAWLMTPPSPSFDVWAFSVCNTDCANNGFTMAHEFGHNQGSHHDHDNAGGMPSYEFSYGHRFNGSDAVEYRTVMAYAPGSRIEHFSNPNVLFMDTPTGVPEGQPQAADNARSINQTAEIVAGFRQSQLDPPLTWSAMQEFHPSDTLGGDRFGSAVAIDGQLAIIGASTDDGLVPDAGSAYILRFDPTSGTWLEEAKIVASDGASNDRFGVAVDIVDGEFDEVAIVGAYQDDDAGRDSGSAYIFRNFGGGWTEQAKLEANDAAGSDLFGRSVAIASVNGNEVALVGAYLHDEPLAINSGAAYVFHSSLGWNQETKLIPSDFQAQDRFGVSVSLAGSNDGRLLAVIGSFREDRGEPAIIDAGAAYVFTKDLTWTQEAKLVASDGATTDHFGIATAAAFVGAEKVALVGSWNADTAKLVDPGAAYIYRNAGSGWAEEAKLMAPDAAANDHFGNAVAIDGNAALIGAYLADVQVGKPPRSTTTFIDAGKAYVFRRTGVIWNTESQFAAPEPADHDQLGFVLDIEDDRIIVGAWEDDNTAGTDAGSIYISAGGISGEDCNENGVPDACDLASGTSEDTNVNGIPDECEVPPDTCPADIAPPGGNGVVNVQDLLAVIGNWGACPSPCPPNCPPDVNDDCTVNVADLLAVIGDWGACP